MSSTSLARTLTLRDLILLLVGAVIGSGIFVVPGTTLSLVHGYVGPALTVWLVGGFLSLLGALTYGELSAANPHAGGLYVYMRDCFGPLPAFLYGWTLFLAIGGGSAATLAVAFSNNIASVISISPIAAKVLSILMLGLIALINVLGTRHSANVQNLTSAVKIAAILLMSFGLLFLGHGLSQAAGRVWPTSGAGSVASGFGLAMLGVLWAYEGWQYGTFAAGEIKDPQRTFPRGFLVGLLALITIYVLANIGYLAALGPEQLAASKSPAATSVLNLFGPTAARLVALAVALSIFSAANGLTLTAPRVYYAMANDGLFFKKLAEVHPKFRTPAVAVIVGTAWAAVLALTGTFEQLLTYVVFTGWIFYALGAACIFVYRKRNDVASLPYRVPGYPLTPILFIASAAALVLNTVFSQPKIAVLGIGIVLLGVPAYLVWRAVGAARKKAPEPSPLG